MILIVVVMYVMMTKSCKKKEGFGRNSFDYRVCRAAQLNYYTKLRSLRNSHVGRTCYNSFSRRPRSQWGKWGIVPNSLKNMRKGEWCRGQAEQLRGLQESAQYNCRGR